jgi:hypothetical protein
MTQFICVSRSVPARPNLPIIIGATTRPRANARARGSMETRYG